MPPGKKEGCPRHPLTQLGREGRPRHERCVLFWRKINHFRANGVAQVKTLDWSFLVRFSIKISEMNLFVWTVTLLVTPQKQHTILANLRQNKWEFIPPPLPLKSRMGRYCVLASACLQPWFGEMWVYCSILFCPSLSESLTGITHRVVCSNHDKKPAFTRFKAKCFQCKPCHLSVIE